MPTQNLGTINIKKNKQLNDIENAFEVLGGLLSGINNAIGPEAVGKPIKNLSGKAGEFLAQLISAPAVSNINQQTQQAQQNLTKGTQLEQPTMQAGGIDNLHAAMVKQLEKSAAEQVKESVATQGVAQTKKFIDEFASATGVGQQQAQQPVQQPVQQAQQQGPRLLKKLLSGFGEGMISEGAPNLYNRQTQLMLQDKELSENKKVEELKFIQEKQKKDYERLGSMVDNIITPKSMDSSSAKSLSFIDESYNSLKTIYDVFKTNPSALKNVNVPGNPIGQKLAFLRDRFMNAKLRDESGATITPQDEKFVKKLFNSIGTGKMLEADETTLFKLETLIADLDKKRNYLSPNQDLQNKVKFAFNSGYSREEIMQFLQGQGY